MPNAHYACAWVCVQDCAQLSLLCVLHTEVSMACCLHDGRWFIRPSLVLLSPWALLLLLLAAPCHAWGGSSCCVALLGVRMLLDVQLITAHVTPLCYSAAPYTARMLMLRYRQIFVVTNIHDNQPLHVRTRLLSLMHVCSISTCIVASGCCSMPALSAPTSGQYPALCCLPVCTVM